MNPSVSLADADASFLDDYARGHGLGRSEAMHVAVQMLRERDLETAYEEAAIEWTVSSEAGAWSSTAGVGIDGETAEA